MVSIEESNKVSDEVRVKNEPICYSQSISQTKKANKVKEEPIDMSQEVEIKAEEKFSETEEFTNKISIAFLNEETTRSINDNNTNQATTSKSQKNKPKSKDTCDKRRYKCNICNKRCIAPSHLVIHRRIHTGEKPFECDVCNKRFNQSSNLDKHRRIHTGERPFNCDVCKKSFITLCHLKTHKTIHYRQNH